MFESPKMVWSYFAPNLRISLKGSEPLYYWKPLDLFAWRKALPNPQVFVRPGTPATRGVRNAGRGGFLAHLFPLPKNEQFAPETHLSIPWWKSVANLLISFQGGFTHRPTGYQSLMNIRKQDNLSTFFSDDGCSLRRVR